MDPTRRWRLIAGALLASVMTAALAGLVLAQLEVPRQSSAPVVLATATPRALDAMGVHLTAAAVPPGCGLLPVRLPACPITKAAAESAAMQTFPQPAQTKLRETVLAHVDISQPYGTQPLHGVEWVVAVDRQFSGFMVAASVAPTAGVTYMCPAPAMGKGACGNAQYLVFVDAWNGRVQRTMGRPQGPVSAG